MFGLLKDREVLGEMVIAWLLGEFSRAVVDQLEQLLKAEEAGGRIQVEDRNERLKKQGCKAV